MGRVKLQKSGNAWEVVADGHLSSCADLELAAAKALALAEVHGVEVELGAGVPPRSARARAERRRREPRARALSSWANCNQQHYKLYNFATGGRCEAVCYTKSFWIRRRAILEATHGPPAHP